ncbi:hypothetical protein M0R89_19480 (plasmid) [Halorussus limi]|uniref:Uncharacterized protein n=1 Tax=Halorussus limi TaxID=2938695 RepID=A0A8U0HYX1_9EURY|nr:hypothetical protein [Halorussus limi]UPV76345.1 hypothetical protein M0R89_19480 [Halorussus limi]
MGTEEQNPSSPVDSGLSSPVHLLAAHLAVLVAVIHVTLGLYNWVRWASAGFLIPRDLRWPLFVFSGVVLVVGLLLAAQGRYRRPLYVGGILLMAVYVVGYFAWHATGHRPLLLFGEGATHAGPLVPFLLDHLFAGPVKFLAIVSEVTLAVLLAYLLVREDR